MKDVVVIGAGKIGATVAGLLASTGDYKVTLADRSPEVLGNLDRGERIRIVAADVEDSLKLVDLLNGQFAVLNAAPFRLTKPHRGSGPRGRYPLSRLDRGCGEHAPCEGARRQC
jgi:saccharopine dehydrogenase-like NADP-dependent oxidoreductase